MNMKRNSYFILVLLMLCACSSDNSDPKKIPYTYSTSEVHYSYDLGFQNGDRKYLSETDTYGNLTIKWRWKDNCSVIPDVVEEVDACRLVYSYDVKQKYYTEKYRFYTFYAITVEWDHYTEYREYQDIRERRDKITNLVRTVKYKACTNGTPEKYIPTDTSPEITSYPDIKGEWVSVSTPSSDSGSGGSTPDNDDKDAKEYSYHSHTVCYHENGDSDNIYIYKSGSDYRASWMYSLDGLDKVATDKIYSGYNTINGVQYMYYVIPYGLKYCFNFNK